MRESTWTPLIVPGCANQTVYVVADVRAPRWMSGGRQIARRPTWKPSSKTCRRVNIEIPAASSRSKPLSAGRRTFRRKSPLNCEGDGGRASMTSEPAQLRRAADIIFESTCSPGGYDENLMRRNEPQAYPPVSRFVGRCEPCTMPAGGPIAYGRPHDGAAALTFRGRGGVDALHSCAEIEQLLRRTPQHVRLLVIAE